MHRKCINYVHIWHKNAQKWITYVLSFTLSTPRWRLTLVAATWSGERWRPATFLLQELDWEPQWSTMSFMLLAVLMASPPSPQSWPGIHPRSLGNMLAILLWRDATMQLLLYRIRWLSVQGVQQYFCLLGSSAHHCSFIHCLSTISSDCESWIKSNALNDVSIFMLIKNINSTKENFLTGLWQRYPII